MATVTTATKAKPTPEMIRQAVLADQAAARAAVLAARKTGIATEKARTKPPTERVDTRKVTVLAKSNPHAAGSRRAGWFKQLKTGMTVEHAVKAGVRSIYLQRMDARGVIKIG